MLIPTSACGWLAIHLGAAIFEEVVPLFFHILCHWIIAKYLLEHLDGLNLSITKFIAKHNAKSLVDVFGHLSKK